MKKSIRLITGLLTSSVLASLVVLAPVNAQTDSAQTNENWNEVNLAVVDNQVIPRYASFDAAASELATASVLFCRAPDENLLNNFQQSYAASMAAWQTIQHIQFGPITYFNWNFRLQYWPDDKGTGGRQLDVLIASQDEAVLTSRSFARQSVGVQGFPALERLLFADDSLTALQNDSFRCQVAQTIASNISQIASGVHERWINEFRITVANADDSDDFESAEDATIDLLKALVETIPKIVDQKLKPALGNSFATSRVRRSESWRSASSLGNIKINLQTLAQLFNGSDESESVLLNSVLIAEDVAAINDIFSMIELTLGELPDSLQQALESESQYASLETLVLQMDELDEALESALKNTDLYLGFNSLDGD